MTTTNRPTNITNATRSSTVADILERVLDKGVVIAGDIKIKLVEIELLTIQIRLVVCSVERAMAMGMDWWRTDPHWSTMARLARVEEQLEAGVAPRALDEAAPPSVLPQAVPQVARRSIPPDPVERRLQAMEATLRRLEERLSASPAAAPPDRADRADRSDRSDRADQASAEPAAETSQDPPQRKG